MARFLQSTKELAQASGVGGSRVGGNEELSCEEKLSGVAIRGRICWSMLSERYLADGFKKSAWIGALGDRQ